VASRIDGRACIVLRTDFRVSADALADQPHSKRMDTFSQTVIVQPIPLAVLELMMLRMKSQTPEIKRT